MPWPELAIHYLRPETRRAQTWRDRVAFGALYVAAGTWSAVAPQAGLSLGERLYLAFQTISALAAAIALISPLRHPPRRDELLKITATRRRQLVEAQITSGVIRAANDLIPALPLLLLFLALQAVSIQELLIAIVAPLAILVAAMAIGPTLLFPILALALYAMARRTWFEIFLITLYAGHLYCKARLASASGCSLHELRRFDPLQPSIVALAFAQVALLAGAAFWPLDTEHKLALGLVLIFGMLTLYFDGFALHWRGVVSKKPLANLGAIVGVPWSVAWVLAALRAGDAFTLNEGAAYFFVWTAMGWTLSWTLGNSAKQSAQREIISLSLSPSGEAP